MADKLEVIRSQMEETRSSLADKIDALENQVLGTVESATSAVADTVENVKDTVSSTVENVKETVAETVETVKDTFNMRKQVEHHPWLAMGGSIATGYVLGRLLTSSAKEPVASSAPEHVEPVRQYSNGAAHSNGHAKQESEEEDESGILHSGMEMIKGLAVGSVMSLVRDLVTRSVPKSLIQDLAGFVDHVTTQLGGKRLWEGEDENESKAQSKGDTGHAERKSSEVGRPMGTARW